MAVLGDSSTIRTLCRALLHPWQPRRLRLGVAGFLLVSVVAVSCSSSEAPPPQTTGCTLNSDCSTGLVCTYKRCHYPCATSADCSTGQDCIRTATGTICQLPEETRCSLNSDCPNDLLCAIDGKCRVQCQSAKDCVSPQQCIYNVCAERRDLNDGGGLVAVLDSGAGAPTSGGASDGSSGGDSGASNDVSGGGDESTGGQDGPTSNDGAGSGGDGGPADASTDGGGPGSCTVRFGNVALGDVNIGYKSGSGVPTPTGLSLINGYMGPGDDASSVNRIETQPFGFTGASGRPAAPVLTTSLNGANSGPVIEAAATSPGGSTAIAYYNEDASGGTLYCAFFNPAGTLAVPPVLLAPLNFLRGRVEMQWVNDRFVMAWATRISGMTLVNLAMYGADGSQRGGASPLSTGDPSNQVAGGDDPGLSLGSSGNVIAVMFRDNAHNYPTVDLFDLNANPTGEPLLVFASPSGNGFAIAGTATGFVAVWHEAATLPSPDAGLLGDGVGRATYLSKTGTVGTTIRIGGTTASAAEGTSDGTRAAFALLYPDGLRFGYATGDLSTGFHTATAITPPEVTAIDEISIANLGGTFGLFHFATNEHRMRGVAEGCNLVLETSDAP